MVFLQDQISCIPNGVDLDHFRPADGPAQPRHLLFIGSFGHLPNLLAVEFFLREVWLKLLSTGATLFTLSLGNKASRI